MELFLFFHLYDILGLIRFIYVAYGNKHFYQRKVRLFFFFIWKFLFFLLWVKLIGSYRKPSNITPWGYIEKNVFFGGLLTSGATTIT